MNIPKNCQRCGANLSETASTMSFFNTDAICMNCAVKERAHPDYDRARQIELDAVRRGDFNFPGIGKPSDL